MNEEIRNDQPCNSKKGKGRKAGRGGGLGLRVRRGMVRTGREGCASSESQCLRELLHAHSFLLLEHSLLPDRDIDTKIFEKDGNLGENPEMNSDSGENLRLLTLRSGRGTKGKTFITAAF